MKLSDRLSQDLTLAIKNQDALRRSVLRLSVSAIRNAEVEKRTVLARKGGGEAPKDADVQLTDEEAVVVLRREARKCEEARDAFRQAGREKEARKEEQELRIVKEYLPEELSDEEIQKKAQEVIRAVSASGPRDAGRVLGRLMPEVKGRADGRRVSAIVEKLLLPHEE